MDKTKENLEQIFNFLQKAGKLKDTYRFSESELLRNKESTADHTWRLSLMAFVLTNELNLAINIEHALKLALIHDIGESLTGDIDYRLYHNNEAAKLQKEQGELRAINELRKNLPLRRGTELYNLWTEYEATATEEAKFIKALDKIETMAYLIENGKKAYYDISEITATYADKHVNNFPQLKPVLNLVKTKLKSEFEKANISWKPEFDKI